MNFLKKNLRRLQFALSKSVQICYCLDANKNLPEHYPGALRAQ